MQIKLLLFFSFLAIKSTLGQIIAPVVSKTIPLGIISYINFKKDISSDLKSLMVQDQEVSKVSFKNGIMSAVMENESYRAAPENYNIGIALIKDGTGKVVGMSKKYYNIHLIGIGNRIFKLEKINKATNQYKLSELQDGKSEDIIFPKRILIGNKNVAMEIFHNLEEIPAAAIPFLINTKGVDKNISKKIVIGFLSSVGARVALLIIQNKMLPR